MRGEPGRVCSGHAGWLRVEVRLVPRTVRAEKESVLSTPQVVEKPERSEWKGQWRTRHHSVTAVLNYDSQKELGNINSLRSQTSLTPYLARSVFLSELSLFVHVL